jgi:hypothetical protein
MVSWPSPGGAWGGEGVDTNGSENETRLVAAGPPGHLHDLIAVAWSATGVDPAAKMLWLRNSKVRTSKKHMFKLFARPLAANAAKNASKWWRCVSLSGDPTRDSWIILVWKCSFEIVQSAVHHALKSLYGVRQSKRRKKILKEAKWHNDHYFGMSVVATEIW